MRIIHQKHDKFFKLCLSNVEIAKDFFCDNLPEHFRNRMDLATFSLEKNSFIDQAYKGLEADILYRVSLKNSDTAYCYLLCEQQTKVDRMMPFRLLTYMIRMMETHLKRYPGACLPIIYPIVLYISKAPWTAPKEIFPLFGAEENLARKLFLGRYHLIDLHRMSDEEIEKRRLSGLFELVLKYRHMQQDMGAFLDKIFPLLNERVVQEDVDFAKIVLRYILDGVELEDEHLFEGKVAQYLDEHLRGEMMTLADKYMSIGRTEGIEKGIEKGVEKGKLEGTKETILRLLKSGFDRIAIASALGLSLDQLIQMEETSSEWV